MPLSGITVRLPADAALFSADQLIRQFRATYPRVVTFLGFGELGYHDLSAFEDIVTRELARFDPGDWVVNTATVVTKGFERGVADVYEIASRLGFRTSGVYSAIALRTPALHYASAFVQDIYFVDDPTWGGYIDGDGSPSETLTALAAITHEAIAIGGGKHTAQEMRELIRHGKRVIYHPLEMHRETSREWHRRKGERLTDFRGAAFHFWSSRQFAST
jgi:hypothetical protein